MQPKEAKVTEIKKKKKVNKYNLQNKCISLSDAAVSLASEAESEWNCNI